MKKSHHFLFLFFFYPVLLWGQSFQFEFFSFEDGFVNPFIYDVEEGPNHQLFIASGDGLGIYNGKKLEVLNTDKGLKEAFITCLKKHDNALYIGHQNGGLSRYENGKISPVKLKKKQEYKVVDMLSFRNKLWVLFQGGDILEYAPGHEKWHRSATLEGTNGLLQWDDALVVTALNGLELFNYENNALISTGHYLDTKSIYKATHLNNKLLLACDEGVYTLNQSKVAHRIHFDREISINDMIMDHSQNIWLSSYQGAYRCRFDSSKNSLDVLQTFKANNGLGTNNIQCVYADFENNIWFGTYGNGLARLQNDFLSFYPMGDENNEINHLQFQDSILYFSSGSSLQAWNYSLDKNYFNLDQSNDIPKGTIATFLKTKSGNFWIGFKEKGLFISDEQYHFKRIKLSESNLSWIIYDILEAGEYLFVATEEGVFQLNSKGEVLKHYSTANGLRHNKVYALFADQYNTVYIGSRSNTLTYIKDQKVYEIELPFEGAILDIVSLYVDENGKWLGTSNNGVLNIQQGNYVWINKRKGLYANNIKAIERDGENYIFIHRDGLSKYNYITGDCQTLDKTNGFAGEVNPLATAWSNNGSLWIGSSRGIIRYSPRDENQNKIAPKIFIQKITVNDKDRPRQKLGLLSNKEYNIKFFVNGISFSNKSISYKYKLEGFDDEWQFIQTNTPIFTYSKLPYGDYRFKVSACVNNECSEIVATKTFTIDKPYYMKWWFFIAVGLLIVAIILLISYLRTRNLKKIRSYLEFNLKIKTREVTEQNELLEAKNKDITDSINYAKRIQQAMLPEPDFLENLYPDSFLIYKPKDIVSGDFYWHKELSESTRIIVCADCTGHGVPGSLLTMIGGASFQKIVSDMRKPDPASILMHLENEFRENLHKRIDERNMEESIPDGMDLVVMMHNHHTEEATFASARRSFIVKTGGEWSIIKGDRYSIGGEISEKQFVNYKFNVREGDRIYLFSDGYPDQIGGERNRKIMTGNVYKMLQETDHMPLSVQGEYLADFYYRWKGEEMQLDDVLFMGMEI